LTLAKSQKSVLTVFKDKYNLVHFKEARWQRLKNANRLESFKIDFEKHDFE